MGNSIVYHYNSTGINIGTFKSALKVLSASYNTGDM